MLTLAILLILTSLPLICCFTLSLSLSLFLSFSAGSYHGISSSPYASAAAATYGALTNGLHSSYPSQQNTLLSGGSGMTSHLTNGLGGTSYDSSTLQPTSSTTPPLSGFYGTRSMSLGMPALPVGQWPSTPILSSPPVSFHSRPSSGNAAPLHSPLTAQVYSADTLRTHSAQSIDVGDSSYSSLQQHSPDQMLPECASTEPSKYCIIYKYILCHVFVCLMS